MKRNFSSKEKMCFCQFINKMMILWTVETAQRWWLRPTVITDEMQQTYKSWKGTKNATYIIQHTKEAVLKYSGNLIACILISKMPMAADYNRVVWSTQKVGQGGTEDVQRMVHYSDNATIKSQQFEVEIWIVTGGFTILVPRPFGVMMDLMSRSIREVIVGGPVFG